MVATPLLMPLWMWATALAGSTLVFQTFVKPRLPVYRLQVHGLPTLRRLKGAWATQLPTRVRLFNENYLPIDVHALQFDIFVSHAADGSLQHVGHIQDRHQQDLSAEYLQHAVSPSCLAADPASSFVNNNNTTNPSVWQIGPRSDFDCNDQLYLKIPSLRNMLYAVRHLLAHFWRGSGRFLILPTTGVAHVQVPAKVQATISLICDNFINTWTMQVEGIECSLSQVQPGFVSLERAAAKIKQHAMENMQGFPATGGVFLATPEDVAASSSRENSNGRNSKMWKDLVRSLEREEHIKLM
jgi:hypothetical protein